MPSLLSTLFVRSTRFTALIQSALTSLGVTTGSTRLQTLTDRLDLNQVGAKAANLSQLRAWGYAVPSGWIWRADEDRDRLMRVVQPSRDQPVIVRSSAVGEDSLQASAAGQYDSIGDVIDRDSLDRALNQCLASYSKANAIAYRRDQASDQAPTSSPITPSHTIAMSLLVQQQIQGVISGVAFSRDPVAPQGDQVAIEVVAGGASALVSGRVTPARYSVTVPETIPEEIPPLAIARPEQTEQTDAVSWQTSPPWLTELTIEATNTARSSQIFPEELSKILPTILQSIAAIARQIECREHGTPQDLEWTYDGDRLWLLQTRPISTLYPIWTRRIAAEVAPGAVHPLSWSISQPLTCGVWGAIFTTVLGDRAAGLDFSQTATLHGSHAYFNASLLGDIFRRMGLPPESLEFLVRDASMSRPSLRSMLLNVPGLLRLVGQQFRLTKTFAHDDRLLFTPLLNDLTHDPIDLQNPKQSPQTLLDRIDRILAALQPATRYNILAPIGLAVRQKLAKVEDLDSGMMPEVQATRAFQALAQALRHHLDQGDPGWETREVGESSESSDLGESNESKVDLRSVLTGTELSGDAASADPQAIEGRALLDRFDAWLERYGYLSDVGTNIAIPTWREQPDHWLRLWWQAAKGLTVTTSTSIAKSESSAPTSGSRSLQEFARLKGRVAEVYDRLLAELRWCFVALEHQGKARQLLPNVLEELGGEEFGDESQLERSESETSETNRAAHSTGDIFWLTIEEIRQIFTAELSESSGTQPEIQNAIADLPRLIHYRCTQFDRDRQRTTLPRLVYGATLPDLPPQTVNRAATGTTLTGIGASRGQVRGRIVLMSQFDPSLTIDRETILVVPYTDAGWSPLLAQVGGLISAVGGRLSHGAIVAREYGIPAVMDVAEAFEQLQPGQWVQIDGERGTIEPIEG